MNFKFDSFTYDDLLLEPALFEGKSRREIDLSTEICGLKMNNPIIAAPMDTVTNVPAIMKVQDAGGMGIIHRFCDYEKAVRNLQFEGHYAMLPIGLVSEEEAHAQIDRNKPDAVLIEVAHAHQRSVLNLAKFIKKEFPNIPLMVGNIASTGAALNFAEIGVDAIKIGVGPSPVCSTRSVTGCGVPQGRAVDAIYRALHSNKNTSGHVPQIIADGGIKNSGHIVKALALGADAVMIGSLLAQATDGPGEVFHIDGVPYKAYRGMASTAVMQERGIFRAAEGVSTKVRATKTISEIINDLVDGIQSGLSYLGFNSLQELKENRDSIVAHVVMPGSYGETGTV